VSVDEERVLEELAEIKVLQLQVSDCLDALLERVDRLSGESPGPGVRFAFIHIPKTGGGTLKGMIAAGGNTIVTSGNFFKAADYTTAKIAHKLGPQGRDQGDVAIGHVPYGTYRSLLPEGVRYFTFLREPVDRVISHFYRHVVDRDGNVKLRFEGADSLETALKQAELPILSNLQTRCLCSDPAPTGPLPDSALDEAKANLETFALFGLQERFVESVVLFQHELDLPLAPSRDLHVNADRPSVDEIPDEERSLIEEHNRLDAELYRHALALFEKRLAGAGADFHAEVEAARAASTEANELDAAQVEAAAAWLERELPPEALFFDAAMRHAGRSAGYSNSQLKRALRVLKRGDA
jgi:hypothetical protein